MIIDTHVHLQMAAYSTDLTAVLERAANAGIRACIIPGTTLDDSLAAANLAEQYNTGPCTLYAAVGIHPTSAHQLTPAVLKRLEELTHHPRVLAIGEIGLDYYWPNIEERGWQCATPEQQQRAFKEQLDLAARSNLPVIVHDRDAHTDTLNILKDWVSRYQPQRTGTLHAYAGGIELLDQVIEAGFYIGIDGPVTFKKAKELHAVAQAVPLDRLLLETDGPYLTPHPYRGKRNEMAYLTLIAERIADLRGISTVEVTQATSRNAQRLFGIEDTVL
ncbi:MAG: TatD family hydrolase [Anaerolineae bacterium]|nr:TatD family hydrolase [Anaerolineae bacterium]